MVFLNIYIAMNWTLVGLPCSLSSIDDSNCQTAADADSALCTLFKVAVFACLPLSKGPESYSGDAQAFNAEVDSEKSHIDCREGSYLFSMC
jgi:hypothetical protein